GLGSGPYVQKQTPSSLSLSHLIHPAPIAVIPTRVQNPPSPFIFSSISAFSTGLIPFFLIFSCFSSGILCTGWSLSTSRVMLAPADGVTPHKKEGSGRLEEVVCFGSDSGFNVEEEEISLVKAEGWDLVLSSSMIT
ncbi:hypothetical protein ASPVEDRAFT_230775, partial [Aspergillus versicolor CBS 583.65]